MKTLIRALLAGALIIGSGGALAQGVTLIRPAQGAPAVTEASRMAALRAEPYIDFAVVSVDPIALDSTIINVQLGDKSFRFVGSKQSLVEGTETWTGRDGEASAVITREQGVLLGHFDYLGKVYSLNHLGNGRYALRTKIKRNASNLEQHGGKQ